MDTVDAYDRKLAANAAGYKYMVFDWHRAAWRIKESGAKTASAGLQDDWEWTGGYIFDGEPLDKDDTYIYLLSNHAVPELCLDEGLHEECWIPQEDSPGWDEKTFWPKTAWDILRGTASYHPALLSPTQ